MRLDADTATFVLYELTAVVVLVPLTAAHTSRSAVLPPRGTVELYTVA